MCGCCGPSGYDHGNSQNDEHEHDVSQHDENEHDVQKLVETADDSDRKNTNGIGSRLKALLKSIGL